MCCPAAKQASAWPRAPGSDLRRQDEAMREVLRSNDPVLINFAESTLRQAGLEAWLLKDPEARG